MGSISRNYALLRNQAIAKNERTSGNDEYNEWDSQNNKSGEIFDTDTLEYLDDKDNHTEGACMSPTEAAKMLTDLLNEYGYRTEEKVEISAQTFNKIAIGICMQRCQWVIEKDGDTVVREYYEYFLTNISRRHASGRAIRNAERQSRIEWTESAVRHLAGEFLTGMYIIDDIVYAGKALQKRAKTMPVYKNATYKAKPKSDVVFECDFDPSKSNASLSFSNGKLIVTITDR